VSQSAMLEVAASTPEDSALQRDTAGTWTRLPLGRRITLSDDTSKLLASLEGWRDESERKSACAPRPRPGSSGGTWSAAACTATRTSGCPA